MTYQGSIDDWNHICGYGVASYTLTFDTKPINKSTHQTIVHSGNCITWNPSFGLCAFEPDDKISFDLQDNIAIHVNYIQPASYVTSSDDENPTASDSQTFPSPKRTIQPTTPRTNKRAPLKKPPSSPPPKRQPVPPNVPTPTLKPVK